MNNLAFQRDYSVVRKAIVDSLVKEGTDLKGLDSQIDNISLAYMVPVKAQWLKVSTLSESGLEKFLVKYQESSTIAMQLLEKYSFESLVKTFRTVNLSPKTKKVLCGIDRYQDFVNKVNNGDILIETIKKPKKQPQKVVSTNLTNAFIKPTNTQKSVSKAKPEVVPTSIKTKNGNFVSTKALLLGDFKEQIGTFSMFETVEGKRVYGYYDSVVDHKKYGKCAKLALKSKRFLLPLVDIKESYVFIKDEKHSA